MIAYVGYTGRRGNFGRTHASIATAAAALARTGGDMLGAIYLLMGRRSAAPAMRVFQLTGERIPLLPIDADITICADLERYCLDFYGVVRDQRNEFWSPLGTLLPAFTLMDVEAVESMLCLTSRPVQPVTYRRLRLVKT